MPSQPIQDKPSRNEDEYFLKRDAELIREHRERLDAERKERERKAHYMKCPKCGSDLAERELEHVKVDVCPSCNGVWLDAGELDLVRATAGGRGQGFLGNLLAFRHK